MPDRMRARKYTEKNMLSKALTMRRRSLLILAMIFFFFSEKLSQVYSIYEWEDVQGCR